MDHDEGMEDSDQSSQDDNELDDVEDGEESYYHVRDSRWILLQALGYDEKRIRVALSHCGRQPVEDVADWLEAHHLEDDYAQAAQRTKSPVDVVMEQVEEVMHPNLVRPEQEMATRRHACGDLCEALDLLEALKQNNDESNLAAGTSSRCLPIADWEVCCKSRDLAGSQNDLKPTITEETGKRTWKCGLASGTVKEAEEGSIGFGVPGMPLVPRQLVLQLATPPYFHFENVASTPKHQGDEISQTLYSIKPEFVDSIHFCASRRARGYVHNLPLEGRRLIIPEPAMTIQNLFPESCGKYWPAWDYRTKLNCIDTRSYSNAPVKRIRTWLEESGDQILKDKQFNRKILENLKLWNLVWTGPNQISPLSPEEIEVILGFDVGHTRGIVNISERMKALGNSFQVNTIAYHLSVLKPMFPGGINVISLFAGIGGAEVALHKLGIPINVLVSVEKDRQVRPVVSNWWEATGQKGYLIHHIHSVKKFTRDTLAELLSRYGEFDLLIGGSPCNNLAGKNRVTRTGLEDKHSRLFYEYKRVLDDLRQLSLKNQMSTAFSTSATLDEYDALYSNSTCRDSQGGAQ